MSRTSGTKSQNLVVAWLDGVDIGMWAKQEGGGVKANVTKYKRGGMTPAVTLGTSAETQNVTLERLFEHTSAEIALRKLMYSRCGVGDLRCAVYPMDADKNIVDGSRPDVYTGTLMEVNPGGADASSDDADVYSIVLATEGSIG